MDMSLLAVVSLIAGSLAVGAIWHALVKSYGWAVFASAVTVGLMTCVLHPMYRGTTPSVLMLADAAILAAVIALAVGVPFKRRRAARAQSINGS